METWTVDQMVKTGACYSPDRIKELWGDRTVLSLTDILALDIPAVDRMWIVWRPTTLTEAQRKLLCDRIVERAVRTYALPYPQTSAWAEQWLTGADRSARAAAARAAWSAAAAESAAARAAEYQRQVDDTLAILGE